jgi:hypothetical protein
MQRLFVDKSAVRRCTAAAPLMHAFRARPIVTNA